MVACLFEEKLAEVKVEIDVDVDVDVGVVEEENGVKFKAVVVLKFSKGTRTPVFIRNKNKLTFRLKSASHKLFKSFGSAS